MSSPSHPTGSHRTPNGNRSDTSPSKKKKRKRSKESPSSSLIRIELAAACQTDNNDDTETDRPIVCSYPGGGAPSHPQKNTNNKNDDSDDDSEEEEEGPQQPEFLWKKSRNHNNGYLVVGKDHACTYSAEAIMAPDRTKQKDKSSKKPRVEPTQLCVGIYDKQTNTLTLHPTACDGSVFALQQSVPTYKPDRTASAALNTAEYQRRVLFQDFGSAKKQRALRSQDANKVNVDLVVGSGSVVQSFVTGESMSASNRAAVKEQQQHVGQQDEVSKPGGAVQQSAMEWRKMVLPPFNPNATKAYLVYDASSIAGTDVWSQLSRVVDACLQKDNAANAFFSSTVPKDETSNGNRDLEWNDSAKDLVSNIVESKPKTMKQQLKCALLLNHFINLLHQVSRKKFIYGPKPDQGRFFGAPIEVGNRFLELFTIPLTNDRGDLGHVMSKTKKDVLFNYTVILYAMAEGGNDMKVKNIKPLADDLKMDVKDAVRYFRNCGFTVKTKKGAATSAVLEVPLTFPDPGRGGGAARGRR